MGPRPFSLKTPGGGHGLCNGIWRSRQDNGEGAALIEFALDAKLAPVAADDVLYDGEAQAGAAEFPGSRGVDPVKALGQSREVLAWNALALVADGDRNPPRRIIGSVAGREWAH